MTLSIIRQSSLAFSLRVIGVALSFLVSVLFARALGVEQYGIYVYWLTAGSIVAALVGLGVPSVVTREIAAARGAVDKNKYDRVICYGLRLTGLSGLALVAVGIAISLTTATAIAQPFWSTTPFLAFSATALGTVSALSIALLLGMERITASLWLGLVAPAATAIGATALWIGWAGSATTHMAMLSTLLAAMFAALLTSSIALSAVRKFRLLGAGSKHTSGPNTAEGYGWLGLGIILAFNQLLTNAITQVDILMLGWLSTPESTAHYHAASRISYGVAFFFGSITGVVAPLITRLYAAGNTKELEPSVQNASMLAFGGTLTLYLAALTLGDYILLLFGRDFLEANRVMGILMLTWLIHSAFGLNHTMLTMAGAAHIATLVLTGAVIVNAILNFVFIPRFGAEGAAISGLISMIGFSLAGWLIVRTRYGYRFDIVQSLKNKMAQIHRGRTKC
jgi:O-antigen/teichoic acid export membrane protein